MVISNKYFGDDLDDQVFDSHLSPLFDNAGFAAIILLASIQKHIESNRTEFEFEHRLKE